MHAIPSRALPWALALVLAIATPAQSSPANCFTTADGTTYAYDFTPAQGSNKTFLLLHGYPSLSTDWAPQVSALAAAGYGVLVPDMLGFGASDLPIDETLYRGKRLGGHLTELLDHEGVGAVIGVGHDWGTVVLSRMIAWYKDRFEKAAFMSGAYVAPGGFLDIDAINAQTLAEFGYTEFGYWYFFSRYDASAVIREHLESYYHIVFPVNDTIWRDHLAPIGGGRAWLTADTITEDPSFLDEAYKAEWMASLKQPDAIRAGLNCYISQLNGVNDEDDALLTEEDWELNIPLLAIGGAKDPVALPQFLFQSLQPWARVGLEEKVLESGHWLMREVAEELAEALLEFGSQ